MKIDARNKFKNDRINEKFEIYDSRSIVDI
jgi:hypothetical protein